MNHNPISQTPAGVRTGLSIIHRRRGVKRCFSLVEAMFAIAITSIGLAAASSLVSFNLKAAYYINARMAAVTIARNRMELIRTVPFADLPLYQENRTRVNASGFPDPAGRFYRTSTIGSLADSTRQVGVSVFSPGVFRGQDIVIPLSTIVMDKSLIVVGK